MAEKTISAIVDGGKATPGPPIGPALGPLGINAGKVVAEINEKTKAFEGTSVPVKIIVDPATKSYRIEVGTPSVPAMIKKELETTKGSGSAKEMKIGELTIDQVIKIAMAKSDSTLARTRKAHV
ncbi:50S ribosomal protein L11, partial [Candidatus Micrarchaeota archaeon]|nr:50S ribosomal protein L11 [Candidatus Micrarchaeota archaeon]